MTKDQLKKILRDKEERNASARMQARNDTRTDANSSNRRSIGSSMHRQGGNI
jgi:hypothetical protein